MNILCACHEDITKHILLLLTSYVPFPYQVPSPYHFPSPYQFLSGRTSLPPTHHSSPSSSFFVSSVTPFLPCYPPSLLTPAPISPPEFPLRSVLFSRFIFPPSSQPLLPVFPPPPPPTPSLLPPSSLTAAITSLAKFGASCEDLLPSILVLLDRCLMDDDDEVRDRALLYLQVLRQKQKALSSAYILNRE